MSNYRIHTTTSETHLYVVAMAPCGQFGVYEQSFKYREPFKLIVQFPLKATAIAKADWCAKH